uniref:Uncharacterized protein n=1 Tax=Euplotes crassus TaxID=5936 RepID=A0A7S3K843_EUPCR|mmetsp:Transcript_10471/g.10321  ORF Transcript_10471/g.10321 Transcript_10471/m.10321 type:complete len:261 (+) Transcript_10471:22-804(+)
MNSSRSSKVRKSKSPGSINKMFHSNIKSTSSNSGMKSKVKKKLVKKSSSKSILSKNSKSGMRSLSVSRSEGSLPIIPGNDLKTIKEIFTRAKKYKMKYGQHKIPVKIMKSEKKSFGSHKKSSRSIPKHKNSSNSVAMPAYSIKKPNKEDIHRLKLSSEKNVTECSKYEHEYLTEEQEVCKTEEKAKSKFGSKKKSPPRSKMKYGIEMSRDANGLPAGHLVHRKCIPKSSKKGTMSTKDDKSEMMSIASGGMARSEAPRMK